MDDSGGEAAPPPEPAGARRRRGAPPPVPRRAAAGRAPPRTPRGQGAGSSRTSTSDSPVPAVVYAGASDEESGRGGARGPGRGQAGSGRGSGRPSREGSWTGGSAGGSARGSARGSSASPSAAPSSSSSDPFIAGLSAPRSASGDGPGGAPPAPRGPRDASSPFPVPPLGLPGSGRGAAGSAGGSGGARQGRGPGGGPGNSAGPADPTPTAPTKPAKPASRTVLAEDCVCLLLALAIALGALGLFFLILCFSARNFGPLASFNDRHLYWSMGVSDEYRDARLDRLRCLRLEENITSNGQVRLRDLFKQTAGGSADDVVRLHIFEPYVEMGSWPGYASRGHYSYWSLPRSSSGYSVIIPRTVSAPTTYTYTLYYGTPQDPDNLVPAEENVSWFRAQFFLSSEEVLASDGTRTHRMPQPEFIFFVYRPSPFGRVFLDDFGALSAHYDTSGLFENDFIGLASSRIVFAHLDDPYLFAACNPFSSGSGWREFVTFLALLLVALAILIFWLFADKVVGSVMEASRGRAGRAGGPQARGAVVYKRKYPRAADLSYVQNRYPLLLY